MMPAPAKPITRLRALVLISLVIGLAMFTGVMLTLAHRLAERFGPEVAADLSWRAERGAHELARTADVGLAVSDPAVVKEAFGAYARASDVMAIVAVDAAGQVIAAHGELANTPYVFSVHPGVVVGGPGYLASWAPAEIEGARVGKVALVISTARLSGATSALDDVARTTIVAGVLGLLLGCLVILVFTRAVASRDRQLQDHAANLERKVAERTRELDERNRGMRLVLDNVAQGFVTIDANGVAATEYSAVVETWFGAIGSAVKLSDVIRPFDPMFATWLDLGLDAVREDVLPRELCIDQLPRRCSAGGRVFDVAYSPISNGEDLARILVIISDVTSAIERERTEREQRELVELFQRITTDRAGFEEFFRDACALVDQLRVASDDVVEKRILHTLKGNCGVFGIHGFAGLCHEIETELADRGASLDEDQRARLAAGWAVVVARIEQLFGDRNHDVIELDRGELQRLVDQARSGIASRELEATLASWLREPVAVRFERLGRQATELARRLGKAEVVVTIADHGIRLPAELWGAFWAASVHAIRNAIDHGVETADARVAAGKPANAAIALSAERRDGRLVIELADDGAGIAWDAVRAKAKAHQLPAATDTDLVAALFADGMTTRDDTSDVSGRGVGLGALRAEVEALGGTITVASTPGHGTTLSFSFADPDLVAELRPPTQPLRVIRDAS